MVDDAVEQEATAPPLLAEPTPVGYGQRILCWVFGTAVLCALCFHWHFRLAIVSGQSMLPTLHSGALLLVHKRAYIKAEPARGDMVLASAGRDLLVKRVVGLPGEEIELKMGRLYINRHLFLEDHPIEPGCQSIGRGKLARGKFALLGDNRALPAGQTIHAVVPQDQIVGKVLWSFALRGP